MASGDVIVGMQSVVGVLEYHRYAPGPSGRIDAHVHDTYQMCYSLNLDGSYEYRGARHIVPAGAMSVLGPGEPHAAADVGDRAWEAEFVTVYPTRGEVEHACARLGRDAAGLARLLDAPVMSAEACGCAMRGLARVVAAGGSSMEQHAAFDGVMGAILEVRDVGQGRRVVLRDVRRVQAARDAMMHDAARDWTVAELARLVHLSEAHFAQLFTAVMGLPPHRFLMQQRVECVRRMLAAGASVGACARAAGFADHSHISRWFKRFVQTTPARYGRQNRRNILIERLGACED
jgi:AraC-like DNA-binding protein